MSFWPHPSLHIARNPWQGRVQAPSRRGARIKRYPQRPASTYGALGFRTAELHRSLSIVLWRRDGLNAMGQPERTP